MVVEEGITDIGKDGLQCGELITAELPDSLESLGVNAVDAQIFHIPKNLSSIDPTCFNTTALRSVSVDPGNKNYRVYDNCLFSGDMKTLLRYNPVIDYYGNARTEYCVPDGVETIGDKAFSYEKSLKKISMADSVRNIGANAFTQCGMANMDSEADIVIELTDSIVSIGDGAFNECPALHYVYIGKNVEYIGKSALAGHFISDIQLHPDNKFFTMRDGVLFSRDMTKLTDTHYDIPEGVIEICDSAFRGFVSSMVSHGNLETVTFPESLVRIGDAAFAEQCNLTKLELPDKLEYIGDHAFSEVGVGKVDSIVIPDSVKYIGEAAFYLNTAKTVVIGSGVEIIGGGAFAADGRPDSNAEPDIRIYFRGTAPVVDVNSHYRPFGFAGYFEDPSVQLYYPAEYKAEWVPGINTQWCPDEQQKEIYFNAVPYHLTEEGEIHYCQTKNNGLTCEEEGNISCVCEKCSKVFYSSAHFLTQPHNLQWEVRKMCCNCRYNCTLLALIASVIAGVVAAFLLITGGLTVTPVYLAVAFAVTVVYLGVLLATASPRRGAVSCLCRTLGVLLVGIVGTIAASAILVLTGIVATSVLSAILVGLLAFFFTLMIVGGACHVRCLADCED